MEEEKLEQKTVEPAQKKEAGWELVIAIVSHGFSGAVMDAAVSAGAFGGTVLSGRGTSKHTQTIYGVQIEPEKEVILMVVDRLRAADIIKAVHEAAGLNTMGSGICFALPVEKAVGLKRYD